MSVQREKRTWLVPETVQTSAMDCGPASLKALLAGYGIQVGYGRLREACQTEVDGTSIDTMEDTAASLGLKAEQKMLPLDYVLHGKPSRLPALVVLRTASGLTHFVLAWRVFFGRVQLMDPATGRRWPTVRQFLDQLFVHSTPAPASEWLEWATSDEFLELLRSSMARGGVTSEDQQRLVHQALTDANPEAIGALDAAMRLTHHLVASGALRKGKLALAFLEGLWKVALSGDHAPLRTIPAQYWFARFTTPDEDGNPQVLLRGAVLVEVHGKSAKGASSSEHHTLTPELTAALEEQPIHPGFQLLRMLRTDGLLAPTAILAALIPASFGIVLQVVLLRGALELPRLLVEPVQRMAAVGAMFAFLGSLLILELPIATGLLRIGRHLEVRFRIAFLRKVPRLGDHYFHSRLTSDMADRSHNIHALRGVTTLGVGLVRSTFTLVFTAAGLVLLDTSGALLVCLVAVLSVVLPLAIQPMLGERDLRVRTHAGALTRFYLDGLLGLTAIRSHGAENAVRTEHEGLLTEWARASFALLRVSLVTDAILALAGLGMAGGLLLGHVARAGENSAVLLLAYWALQLPAIGQELALQLRGYPSIRSVTLRLMEPLAAPEQEDGWAPGQASSTPDGGGGAQLSSRSGKVTEKQPGLAIRMQNLEVVVRGQTILSDVNLDIPSGAEVAIVGRSGAGKSSLLGVLLGWFRPTKGQVLVDDLALQEVGLDWIRGQSAWVDPAVQLWNRTFLDNLLYGAPRDQQKPLSQALDIADLRKVLERMPDGLQTLLGEGGALASGGEGQRIRIGRALLREKARLVLLDEAFRGLDRTQARKMLARCRDWWKNATLVCVTHDMHAALEFPRVVVIKDGRVVEDSAPDKLAQDPASEFHSLLASQDRVQKMWNDRQWRQVRIENGILTETRGESSP